VITLRHRQKGHAPAGHGTDNGKLIIRRPPKPAKDNHKVMAIQKFVNCYSYG
jgi:hypothetical protein